MHAVFDKHIHDDIRCNKIKQNRNTLKRISRGSYVYSYCVTVDDGLKVIRVSSTYPR